MNIVVQCLQVRQPQLIQMFAWLSQDIGLGREQGITSICRDFDVRVTEEEVQ